jgi:leader peptidase (prepilin peptidase)/N-methyltransferase
MEILLAGIGAWLIAYLINYLADVLPITRRFSPAACLHCEQPFPLKSYLLFQPCPTCGQRRSIRTWVVQIAFTLITIWLWVFPPALLGFWVGSGLLAFFALIAVIDLEYRLIMDPVSLFGAVLGLAIGTWQKGIWGSLLGGIAGYGIMFGLFYLGILFNRLMSKIRHEEVSEEAMGFGDVNLSGILGLMLGWPDIIGGLLTAIIAGGLVSGLIMLGMLVLRRYKALTAIPYAPFLLIGAIVFLYIPK